MQGGKFTILPTGERLLSPSLDRSSPSKSLRQAKSIPEWLERWKWTHFITLAFNDPMVQSSTARDKLKGWCGRMNRLLVGPKWFRRPDEQLFMFAFFEKPGVHPHWHILLMLDDVDPAVRLAKEVRLPTAARMAWGALSVKGNTDVRRVDLRDGICRYVTKELRRDAQYQNFVVHDEFRAG